MLQSALECTTQENCDRGFEESEEFVKVEKINFEFERVIIYYLIEGLFFVEFRRVESNVPSARSQLQCRQDCGVKEHG